MDRRKGWFWTLALVAAAACSPTSEDGGNCPPLCITPNPVQTADSGTGLPVAMPPSSGGLGDAGFDAGKPSVTPSTGGMTGGGADTGVVMLVDAGLNPLGDSGMPARGDAAAPGDASVGGDGGVGSNGSMLPPVTDYGKPGPFKATKQANVGPSNNYTVFRPDPLGANGFLHSPIIFGPGIATSGADDYDVFLNHLATHGYVVLSVNSMDGGPGDPGNDTAMRAGLDWLIAQNNMAGVYQGKLAANRAVTMGYSIGATSAVLISDHPAVMTSVAIHGHEPMKTAKPHGPVLLLTGDGITELPDGPKATIQALTSVPVILGLYKDQAHITVIWDQLAQDKPEFLLITAWLRYWVNGDDPAKAFFWGANCKICSDSNWTITKNAAWDAQKL